MRVASQGETADRITLEMLPGGCLLLLPLTLLLLLLLPSTLLLLLLLLLLSPKTTGISQQLEERLGRSVAGSEGSEDGNGRGGLDF